MRTLSGVHSAKLGLERERTAGLASLHSQRHEGPERTLAEARASVIAGPEPCARLSMPGSLAIDTHKRKWIGGLKTAALPRARQLIRPARSCA